MTAVQHVIEQFDSLEILDNEEGLMVLSDDYHFGVKEGSYCYKLLRTPD